MDMITVVITAVPVSYTHLDVYKRQIKEGTFADIRQTYNT